ncbi:MAG: hypothetical protein ACT4PT_12955 [Methanobacteriota archaeon]
MVHAHDFSAAMSAFVGVASLLLAAAGFRSYRTTGSRNLPFVAGAFLLFAGKGFLGAWAIYARSIPHEHLELILSIADAVIVALLVTPLLRGWLRRGRATEG